MARAKAKVFPKEGKTDLRLRIKSAMDEFLKSTWDDVATYELAHRAVERWAEERLAYVYGRIAKAKGREEGRTTARAAKGRVCRPR